jgi:uncharacterized OsmC-like protein
MSKPTNVRVAQETLRTVYKLAPDAARAMSYASTVDRDPTDAFRATLFVGAGDADVVPFAAEHALGGPNGMPAASDFLCGALAASQDSNIRMAANRWGVPLDGLNVEVRGWFDVRGAMSLNTSVPVGFQGMQCTVRLAVAPGTDDERVARMLIEAEQSCIVLATLRRALPVYMRLERATASPLRLAA